MDSSTLMLGIALIAGCYMAWSIGANDVANTMGTSVGSHAITIRKAIIIAAIFEFLGAFLVGEQVTNTIKQGIVDPAKFIGTPMEFAAGMTAALFATAVWLQIASARGLPVSTTHSIIGAVVGFGLVTSGAQVVQWNVLGRIVVSWFVSPLIGGVIAFATFFVIRKYILDSRRPLWALERLAPFMFFFAVSTFLSVFFKDGLRYFAAFSTVESTVLAAVACGLIASLALLIWIKRVGNNFSNRDKILAHVEHVFALMQVVTACFMALAHGSNDVANAIGPVAAVVNIVQTKTLNVQSTVPYWLLGLGGLGIVVGLATYGRKVIETVGKSITEITPTRGFSAEFASAFTILVGSYYGMPLSTTQVLVGAVIGVGMARGIAGLNIAVIRRIMGSWIITIPMTAAVSAVFCFVIQLIL